MSTTFVDTVGKTWSLALTIGVARRIKERRKIDLLSVTDPKSKVLEQLAGDGDLFCAVLWDLVASQAEEAGVSELQFWDLVDDRTLSDAGEALTAALLGFFRPGRREIVEAAIEVQKQQERAVADRLRAMAAANEHDGATIERMAKGIAASLSTSGA